MRRMSAILCLVAVWTCPALAAGPFTEARIATEGTIVAGQQIQLEVTVFAPNYFTSAPQFPLFDLPSTIVTLPDVRAQNLNKTVDGQQFSGIRRTYLVIPQIAGEYSLPPAAISLSYAATPGQSTAATVTLPPAKFTAAELPGPGTEARTLVATALDLSQSLDHNPADLKVGDTLVRTVSLFAEGTQAMMLPQPKFEAPTGVRLYAPVSALEDNITGTKGTPGSKRTDRVTYIVEQAGTFTLPALRIDWFDTNGARVEQVQLEPLILSVKASPAPATAIAPDVPKENSTQSAMPLRTILMGSAILLVAALLGALGWRGIPRMLRWMDAREKMMEQSEPARFRQLYLSLNSDDAKAAYVALEAWTRSGGYRSIADWSVSTRDREIDIALSVFEADLFRNQTLETSKVHMNALASAILTWRGGQSTRPDEPRDKNSALPTLNP